MCSTVEYPENFLCPITCDIMDDPVAAKDGHTYERSAIQRWFDQGKRSSPVTNAVMRSTDLVPNHFVKSQISAWRDQNEGDAGVDNRIKVRFPLFAFSSLFVLLCLLFFFCFSSFRHCLCRILLSCYFCPVLTFTLDSNARTKSFGLVS